MTGKRSIVRGIADALAGLPLFLTAPLYQDWHLGWGATDSELREPMLGDDAVTRASFSATRAITINAPPLLLLLLGVRQRFVWSQRENERR